MAMDARDVERLIKEGIPGAEVTIDVAASTLTLPDGRSVNYPIDSFARYCLLEGIDQLGFLQQHDEQISRFEESRSWTP